MPPPKSPRIDGSATFTTTASKVITKNPSTAAASDSAAVSVAPTAASPPEVRGFRKSVRVASGTKPIVRPARRDGQVTLIGVLPAPPCRPRVRRSVDTVATGSDIREFLTSRRACITPAEAGLRAHGGRRRVPGLRREEVAMLAGISVEYYTQLERGNVRGVSEDVLDAVARALRLDDVERTHLIDLVRVLKQRPT